MMRLNDWRRIAPDPTCLGEDMLAALGRLLPGMGSEADPECWVVWGEDPERRYSVLVPTAVGVLVVAVRVGAGADGPRVTGKLARWSKLSLGEISLEVTGERRIIAVQVEGMVLKGVDEEADRICEFCLALAAGVEGRPPNYVVVPPGAELPVAAWGSQDVWAAAGAREAGSSPAPLRALGAGTDRSPRRAGSRSSESAAGAEERGGRSARTRDAGSRPAGAGSSEPEAEAGSRRTPRTPAGRPQPAWVPPHPIGQPVGPIQPPAGTPSPLKPASRPRPPAAPETNPAPAPGSAPAWDVPKSRPEPGKQSRPTWRP
jgi:hypothetical protein